MLLRRFFILGALASLAACGGKSQLLPALLHNGTSPTRSITLNATGTASSAPHVTQLCNASPGATVTSITVSCGTQPVAGGVLYSFVYQHPETATISPPDATWNRIDTCVHDGDKLGVYVHAIQPAESSSYTWSWGSTSYYAHVTLAEVQGVNASAPTHGHGCAGIRSAASPQTIQSASVAAQSGDLALFVSAEANSPTPPSAGSVGGANAGSCALNTAGTAGAIYLALETCGIAAAPGATSATLQYSSSSSGGYVTDLIFIAPAVASTPAPTVSPSVSPSASPTVSPSASPSVAPSPAGNAPAPVVAQICDTSPGGMVTSVTVSCSAQPTAGGVLYSFVSLHPATASIAPPDVTWNRIDTCRAGDNELGVYVHAVQLGEPASYAWSWGTTAYYAHVTIAELQGVNASDPTYGHGCSGIGPAASPQTIQSASVTAQAGDFGLFVSGQSNAWVAPSAGSMSGANSASCTLKNGGTAGAIYLALETCGPAAASGATTATLQYSSASSGGYATDFIFVAPTAVSTPVPSPTVAPSPSIAPSPSASPSATPSPVPGPPRFVDYAFVAHPDDEIEGWGAVQSQSDSYPFVVLLTRGENTAFCDTVSYNQGYQPALGELPANPVPTLHATSECAQARVNSFNAFLDDLASVDPQHDDIIGSALPLTGNGPALPSGCGALDTSYWLWVGAHHARLVLNVGDGNVQPCAIPWALQVARSVLPQLPVRTERNAIGDSYYGPSATCTAEPYLNSDHGAIYTALRTIALGVPGKQLQRACQADGATLDYVLPTSIQQFAFPSITGAIEKHYGWLSVSPNAPPADCCYSFQTENDEWFSVKP